jgi:antitoxin component of RelBE/YafQ-DinJ toxin-antitoxin module
MKDNYLHIRITEDLKEQARKTAESDGRDLSNWILWLIKQAIDKAPK